MARPIGCGRVDDARAGHGHAVPGRGHVGYATVYYGLLGHLEQVEVGVVGAVRSGDKIVLVAQKPFLVATIDRVDVDQMARVLLEILLEGAELELHRGVGEVEQTIWHVDVVEGARQGHDGRVVAQIDGDTLRVGRGRAPRWVVLRLRVVLVDQQTARVGPRVERGVARVVGPDPEGSAVNQTELVVR